MSVTDHKGKKAIFQERLGQGRPWSGMSWAGLGIVLTPLGGFTALPLGPCPFLYKEAHNVIPVS